MTAKGGEYYLNTAIRINNEVLKASDNQWDNFLLFLYEEEIFLWKKAEDALIAKKFNKTLRISEKEWLSFLKEVIMPLTKEY